MTRRKEKKVIKDFMTDNVPSRKGNRKEKEKERKKNKEKSKRSEKDKNKRKK